MDTNTIVTLADNYYNYCNDSLIKIAIIKKLPNGKYRVMSHTGKNLGTYDSKKQAKERLRQVEFFKHKDSSNADDKIIDLKDADEFTFSAIMRKLNKICDKEQVYDFLKIYKSEFDNALKQNLQQPDKIALQNSIVNLSKKYKVKLNKDMVKNAAIVSELGDPAIVGKYLADIIRFTLNRISLERRPVSIQRVRTKRSLAVQIGVQV
jgi:hypothetical protein